HESCSLLDAHSGYAVTKRGCSCPASIIQTVLILLIPLAGVWRLPSTTYFVPCGVCSVSVTSSERAMSIGPCSSDAAFVSSKRAERKKRAFDPPTGCDRDSR